MTTLAPADCPNAALATLPVYQYGVHWVLDWTDETQPRVEYRRAPRFRIAKGWVSTMTRVTFGW